jgi:hypothetical protein
MNFWKINHEHHWFRIYFGFRSMFTCEMVVNDRQSRTSSGEWIMYLDEEEHISRPSMVFFHQHLETAGVVVL